MRDFPREYKSTHTTIFYNFFNYNKSLYILRYFYSNSKLSFFCRSYSLKSLKGKNFKNY